MAENFVCQYSSCFHQVVWVRVKTAMMKDDDLTVAELMEVKHKLTLL